MTAHEFLKAFDNPEPADAIGVPGHAAPLGAIAPRAFRHFLWV
jgi:hypothetical protein